MHRPNMLRALLGLACLLSVGCEQVYPLSWSVTVPDAIDADVAILHATLRESGCGADDVLVYEHQLRPAASRTDEPPEVYDGRFCFAAVAQDATCRTIARAEQILTVPAGDDMAMTIDLELVPLATPEDCPGICTPSGCRVCPADETPCSDPPRCCPSLIGRDACEPVLMEACDVF